jgi:hypothetical protein
VPVGAPPAADVGQGRASGVGGAQEHGVLYGPELLGGAVPGWGISRLERIGRGTECVRRPQGVPAQKGTAARCVSATAEASRRHRDRRAGAELFATGVAAGVAASTPRAGGRGVGTGVAISVNEGPSEDVRVDARPLSAAQREGVSPGHSRSSTTSGVTARRHTQNAGRLGVNPQYTDRE